MSDNDVRLRVQSEFFQFINRISKEGLIILMLGGCSYLLLSLLGFDARDPGWSHLGYSGEVSNWMGRAGAWLADVTFSFVGYMGYALPVLVSWRGIAFFRQSDEGLLDRLPFMALRTLGLAAILVGGTAMASLHLTSRWLELPFSAGGLLGLTLADRMVPLFDLFGSSLLLLCVLLVGVSLLTGMSWLSVAEAVGERALWLAGRVRAGLAPRDAATTVDERGEPGRDLQSNTDDPELSDSLRSRLLRVARRDPVDEPERAARLESTPDNPTIPVLNVTPEADGGVGTAAPVREARIEPELSEALPEHPARHDRLRPGGDPESRQDRVAFEELSAVDDLPPWSAEPLDRADDPTEALPADSAGPIHGRHLKIVPLSQRVAPTVDTDAEPNSGKIAAPAAASSLSPLPGLDLLDPPEPKGEESFNSETLEELSRLLEAKLKDFGVVAEVVEVNPGPVITRFEIQPAPGVKVSKITNLAKDLARSLAVRSVRVVEVIAGKSTVGIEIPNQKREIVRLSEVLGSDAYRQAESRLSLSLGNDIAGNPVVVNLAKMPHLLVAGTTGSGKSVGVNAMILSLLFKATPEEVRLIMVDPKMLELSIYDGIPHLLTPVITDMKDAAAGLRWCVGEMERRYRLMAAMGVRNLAGFNAKVREARARGEPLKDPLWKPEDRGFDPNEPAPELERLPYIVVVIDEFADMMMIVGKKVEELIARIAQKARAAGIHLVLATQRPSVDVITGLIKANIPTRIAFQVSSKIDSRTILDQGGAEHLLGNGDMLYQPAGTNMPVRVHGAFVADDEVHRVVEAWKLRGEPEFIDDLLADSGDGEGGAAAGGVFEDEQDPLYDQAVDFVIRSRRASISAVQRKLKIGYNRAARLVETMEAAGVVSEAAHNGTREVLVPEPVE